MDNVSSAINAIYALLGILAIWMIIFYCWRPYGIEAFREDLRELRAELFNLAADRETLFSHPSYILLCNRIDSMSKWAPRLTLTHLVVAYFFAPSCKSLLHSEWEAPGEGHPLRERIIAIHQWLLLRAFFQATHIPSILLSSGRVVWGLSKPVSQSSDQIRRAVAGLDNKGLLDPVRLLVLEAVKATKAARANA